MLKLGVVSCAYHTFVFLATNSVEEGGNWLNAEGEKQIVKNKDDVRQEEKSLRMHQEQKLADNKYLQN